MYINLNKNNMDNIKDGVVLVDFWAPWCGPCRMISPIIEELGIEYQDKAKICKINTDEEQDLAIEYKIRSIPTILFFKDGKKVTKEQVEKNKKEFDKKLDAAEKKEASAKKDSEKKGEETKAKVKKSAAEEKEDLKETASSKAAEKKVKDKVTGKYKGKKVYTGPKGGKYYINKNGNKTYID